MRHRKLTLLTSVLLLMMPAMGSEFRPLVVIYDERMPALANGVAEILRSSSQGEEFLVVTDPARAASLLGLPNVRCVLLTSVSAAELHGLIGPMTQYFQSGGSAIGFYGSCWQDTLGDMARMVFPAYANSSIPGARINGLNVNEYVRDGRLGGIGETLPDQVNLVGQFIAIPKHREKGLVFPVPPTGNTTVLFRDRDSDAPLVIAYEAVSGSRSVTFTGLFLRDNPNAGNHYEKLLEQPEFRTLLLDSYRWASEGNRRYDSYAGTYEKILEDHQKQMADLIAASEERRASSRGRRALVLAVFWILGLACTAGLAYWAFARPKHG